MQIKIDENFKSLLPELTAEQYTGLEKDIVKHGVLDPLIVWNGTLIDGHNRYAICEAHHITNIPTKEIKFENKAEAMKWIIDHQSARRNLLKTQLVEAWSKYEEERAREAAGRTGGRPKKDEKLTSNLMQVSDNPKRNPTVASEVASKIGVSENTYRDMKLVTEKGTQEQKDRMNKGGKGNGASRIANEIRNRDVPDGMKKCTGCQRILPLTPEYFYIDKNGKFYSKCRECKCKSVAKYSEQNTRDIKGNKIGISDQYKNVSDEDISNGLKDDGITEGMTIQEVVSEFMSNFRKSMDNMVSALKAHGDVISDNKAEIGQMWEQALNVFEEIRKEFI